MGWEASHKRLALIAVGKRETRFLSDLPPQGCNIKSTEKEPELSSQRRRRVIMTSLVALALVVVAARSGATNVQTDSSDSVRVSDSSLSAVATSDWTTAIAQVYLSGMPARWTPVNTQGITWTPTLTRIERGGTHFAYFSLPDGSMWAASEDDGTLWLVHDYYHTADGGWTLASDRDVVDKIAWFIHLVILIAKIIDVLAVLAVLVMLILWIKHRLDTGHWFKTSDNQLTQGTWLGDPHGFTELYYDDPSFRSTVTAWPPLTSVGADFGWWFVP